MTPAELLANVISRSEATRNLLNDNNLRFLPYARNDKILYFAEFILKFIYIEVDFLGRLNNSYVKLLHLSVRSTVY